MKSILSEENKWVLHHGEAVVQNMYFEWTHIELRHTHIKSGIPHSRTRKHTDLKPIQITRTQTWHTHTHTAVWQWTSKAQTFVFFLFIYLFIFPVVNTIWFHAFNLKLREAKLCTRRCWPDTIRAWGRGRSLGDRKEWLQHISTPEFHLCPRREKIK